jgi:hypothetical protein
MSEPGSVDEAILAVLLADDVLVGLVDRAVFFGLAPQGFERFVVVDRLSGLVNRDAFGEPYGETFLYLVKAVTPGTATNGVRAAAVRIRELLDGCETLAAVGYTLQRPIEEIEAVRLVEVDDANPDRSAQHWGGHYEVNVQRIAETRRRRHEIPRQKGIGEDGEPGGRRRLAQQVDVERGDG